MTKIMKGGVAYNSTSNIVALTQAEYNALSTAQKNNGNFYCITDADPSYFSAENIDYDNTDSGLSAINIQDAIDEIAQVTTPTITLTKTSGVWTDRNKKTRQFGNIVLLNFEAIGNGSSVASGSDGYVGTVDILPFTDTYSITYYGSYVFCIRLTSDGKIYIRNANSSAFTLPTGDWLNITLTYLI